MKNYTGKQIRIGDYAFSPVGGDFLEQSRRSGQRHMIESATFAKIAF